MSNGLEEVWNGAFGKKYLRFASMVQQAEQFDLEGVNTRRRIILIGSITCHRQIQD